jgi:hypothetical protein
MKMKHFHQDLTSVILVKATLPTSWRAILSLTAPNGENSFLLLVVLIAPLICARQHQNQRTTLLPSTTLSMILMNDEEVIVRVACENPFLIASSA